MTGTLLVAGTPTGRDYVAGLLKFHPALGLREIAKRVRSLAFDFWLLFLADLSVSKPPHPGVPPPSGLLTIDRRLLAIRSICRLTGLFTGRLPQVEGVRRSLVRHDLVDDVFDRGQTLHQGSLTRLSVGYWNEERWAEALVDLRRLASAYPYCPF